MRRTASRSPATVSAGPRRAPTLCWKQCRDSARASAGSCCDSSGGCRASCAPASTTWRRFMESAGSSHNRSTTLCTRRAEIPYNRSPVKFPIANYLTVARIVMIPLVVILFYAPYPWSNPAAAVVFIAAAVTDSLDGYLARKLGQTSALGAFLDPVADKLMVAVALVLLVSQDRKSTRL